MQSLKFVTRIHVLAGVSEHDEQGAEAFREAQGFDTAGEDILVERGKRYDARSLLAFALGKAARRPVEAAEVPADVTTPLRELGFTVSTREELENPAPKRAAAARAPRATTTRTATAPKAPTRTRKPEPVYNVCPTCFMAIPSTGVCDNCG